MAEPTTAGPSQGELLHPRSQDWLLYNHDYRSQRHSRLDQINTSNASSLVPVCALQLGTTGSFEAGPLLYQQNGRRYLAVTNKAGWLYLYDRATHALLSKSEVSIHSNAAVSAARLRCGHGRQRWAYHDAAPIGGGTATYAVDGRQYVMVASGNASRTMARPGGGAARPRRARSARGYRAATV